MSVKSFGQGVVMMGDDEDEDLRTEDRDGRHLDADDALTADEPSYLSLSL